MREKQLKILHKHYNFVLAKLKSCSDKHFEKWLELSKILKNKIIELESSVQS